jgi:hypothetical protein
MRLQLLHMEEAVSSHGMSAHSAACQCLHPNPSWYCTCGEDLRRCRDENQRLRDALERIANLTGAPEYHVHMLRIAREALAGDAE